MNNRESSADYDSSNKLYNINNNSNTYNIVNNSNSIDRENNSFATNNVVKRSINEKSCLYQ